MTGSDSTTRAEPNRPAMSLRYHDVRSADGTKIQAWTNDAVGPTVLLCNGLGTNPHAWPALLDRDCGVRIVSWNHRGVGGSERPRDIARVGIDAFVDDAVAVLDDAGVQRCPVIGWSIGVNTAFEMAVQHPDRVSGILAVAGVPGATFASVGAPLFIPRFARRPVARAVMRSLGRLGPILNPLTARITMGPVATYVLQRSGLMFPGADPDVVREAVTTYLDTPIEWGMHLARGADQHARVSLSKIAMPTIFLAGKYDMLASARDMKTAASCIPDSEYVELAGSHFIQMERPQDVHRYLLALVDRIG
ncbi:MAG: alpha/beta hydrolase [Pseudonocardiales bacterium]|nr:MAG: alpha/beta hydrolase [Pseudonocardiales bacterium]